MLFLDLTVPHWARLCHAIPSLASRLTAQSTHCAIGPLRNRPTAQVILTRPYHSFKLQRCPKDSYKILCKPFEVFSFDWARGPIGKGSDCLCLDDAPTWCSAHACCNADRPIAISHCPLATVSLKRLVSMAETLADSREMRPMPFAFTESGIFNAFAITFDLQAFSNSQQLHLHHTSLTSLTHYHCCSCHCRHCRHCHRSLCCYRPPPHSAVFVGVGTLFRKSYHPPTHQTTLLHDTH